VLVSRDLAYLVKSSISVAEISRTIRVIPSEVSLGKRDGMPTSCAINTDNLLTISKSSLESRIATLSADKLEQLDDALRYSLGLR
jgi:mRNA interferase MazF